MTGVVSWPSANQKYWVVILILLTYISPFNTSDLTPVPAHLFVLTFFFCRLAPDIYLSLSSLNLFHWILRPYILDIPF